jgi:hypothetical protein
VGPGTPETLEAAEEFVFLRLALCMTLLEEWLTALPRGVAPRIPKSQWLGTYLLAPGPWLVSYAERERRIGLRFLVDREPMA